MTFDAIALGSGISGRGSKKSYVNMVRRRLYRSGRPVKHKMDYTTGTVETISKTENHVRLSEDKKDEGDYATGHFRGIRNGSRMTSTGTQIHR